MPTIQCKDHNHGEFTTAINKKDRQDWPWCQTWWCQFKSKLNMYSHFGIRLIFITIASCYNSKLGIFDFAVTLR